MGPDRSLWKSLIHPFMCSLDRYLPSTYSVPGPRADRQVGAGLAPRWGANVNCERHCHYGERGLSWARASRPSKQEPACKGREEYVHGPSDE